MNKSYNTQNLFIYRKTTIWRIFKCRIPNRNYSFYDTIINLTALSRKRCKIWGWEKICGGKITIISKKDNDGFKIIVLDDGVGYNLNKTADDGRTHIGINNVRSRLTAQSNGTLIIESILGAGSTATIFISEKERENHENHENHCNR